MAADARGFHSASVKDRGLLNYWKHGVDSVVLHGRQRLTSAVEPLARSDLSFRKVSSNAGKRSELLAVEHGRFPGGKGGQGPLQAAGQGGQSFFRLMIPV